MGKERRKKMTFLAGLTDAIEDMENESNPTWG